jgi:hypothetical protein
MTNYASFHLFDQRLTTVSGDIVTQIPNVSGYVTQTQLTTTSGDIVTQAGGGSVDPSINGGRLIVTPAYMNTTSDSALQLNAVDKKALFGWTQEIAHELPSFSAYLTAIGAAGDVTGTVYLADSNGKPTGDAIYEFTAIASGSSANVWVRQTAGTPPQLYPGKRYCCVFSIDEGSDISMSYNRQNTALDSGLVAGCWSKRGLIPQLNITQDSHTDFWSDHDHSTWRISIPAGSVGTSGTSIRLGFKAGSDVEQVITHAAVVERSGTSDDGVTTPTPLSFGGTPGKTIAAGTTEYATAAYTWDDTKDHLVILDLDLGSNGKVGSGYATIGVPGFLTYYKQGGGPNYNSATFTSDSVYTDNVYSLVEVKILDGVTSWIDITKDGQPALLNVVIASTTDHCPQLVYGWTGNNGNKVALYSEDTSLWGLTTIPDEGLLCNLGTQTAGHTLLMDVHLYLDTIVIHPSPIDDGRAFQDGIEIIENQPGNRFIGLVMPIERITGTQAPIRCDTYNTLWNAENQTEQVMRRQPYAGDAAEYFCEPYITTNSHDWKKIGYQLHQAEGGWTDFDATFLCSHGSKIKIEFINPAWGSYGAGNGQEYMSMSIGIDSISPHPKSSRVHIRTNIGAQPCRAIIKCETELSEGIHSAFPVFMTWDYAQYSSIVWWRDGSNGSIEDCPLTLTYMG